jgi:hypothetical protein
MTMSQKTLFIRGVILSALLISLSARAEKLPGGAEKTGYR